MTVSLIAAFAMLAGAEPVEIPNWTPCQVAADPATFAGQQIALYGRYEVVGEDRSVLTDEACPDVSIELNLTTQPNGADPEFDEALQAWEASGGDKILSVTMIGVFRSYPGEVPPLQFDVETVFAADVE